MRCIYAFIHTSGKIYVGQASDFELRLRAHKRELKRGAHCNKYLQNTYNRDGWAFSVEILEEVTGDLTECEQYWIDALDTANPALGYNICPAAGSTKGLRFNLSQEARDNHARANRELAQDPEFQQKRILALKAKMKTAEWLEHVRAAAKRKTIDREECSVRARAQHMDPVKKAKHVKACRNATIYKKLRAL